MAPKKVIVFEPRKPLEVKAIQQLLKDCDDSLAGFKTYGAVKISACIARIATIGFPPKGIEWSNESTMLLKFIGSIPVQLLNLTDVENICKCMARFAGEDGIISNNISDSELILSTILQIVGDNEVAKLRHNINGAIISPDALVVVFNAAFQIIFSCTEIAARYKLIILLLIVHFGKSRAHCANVKTGMVDVCHFLLFQTPDASFPQNSLPSWAQFLQGDGSVQDGSQICFAAIENLLENMHATYVGLLAATSGKAPGARVDEEFWLQVKLLSKYLRTVLGAGEKFLLKREPGSNSASSSEKASPSSSPPKSLAGGGVLISSPAERFRQVLFEYVNRVYHSIVQQLYNIFEKVAPQLQVQLEQQQAKDQGKVEDLQQLQTVALQTLRVLALCNPGLFLNNWQLFFMDHFKLDDKLRDLCQAISEEALAGVPNPQIVALIKDLPLKSILLQTICKSPCGEVRNAGLQCLMAILDSLSVRKWLTMNIIGVEGARLLPIGRAGSKVIGPPALKSGIIKRPGGPGAGQQESLSGKITALIMKISRIALVLLYTEESRQDMAERTLELSMAILSGLPLLSVDDGGDGPKSAQQGEYEHLAVTMIHVAMRALSSNCHFLLANPPHADRQKTVALIADWMGSVSVKFKKTAVLQRAYRIAILPPNAASKSPSVFVPAMFRLAHQITCSSSNKPCGNSLRTLVETLSTQCASLIFRDVEWLQGVLQDYLNSSNVLLRLLANRVICNLVAGSDSGSGLVGATPITLNGVESPLVQHAVCHQLALSLDEDHVTRSKAITMQGSYSAAYWRTVFNVTPSTPQQNAMMTQFWAALLKLPNSSQKEVTALTAGGAVGSTLRDAMLLYSMHLALDKIGTVRTNAYKSLGDMVSQCGLNRLTIAPPQQLLPLDLDDEILGSRRVGLLVEDEFELSDYECALCHHLMTLGRLGCLDTKLSVRIQAAWMVGNVVTAILPMRNAFIAPLGRRGDAAASVYRQHCSWVEDRTWLDLFRIQLALLSDSEKIIPTAIHCLGILLGGMQPLRTHHYELMVELHSIILQQYLKIDPVAAKSFGEAQRSYDHLTHEIEHGSQKLLIGICQCLGFFVWVTLDTAMEVVSTESRAAVMTERASLDHLRALLVHCAVEVVSTESRAAVMTERASLDHLRALLVHCLYDIDIHLNFLRHGQLKLKLLAMKIVTYYLHTLAVVAEKARTSAVLREVLDERVLHSLFKRAVEYILYICNVKYISPHNSPPHAAATSAADAASPFSTSSSSPDLDPSGAPRLIRSLSEFSTIDGSSADSEAIDREIARIMSTRSQTLQLYAIVLLWSILRQYQSGLFGTATAAEALHRMEILELLLYYESELVSWFSRTIAENNVRIGAAEDFTIGLPKVSVVYESLQLLEGKFVKDVVADIVRGVAALGQDSLDAPSSARSPFDGINNLQKFVMRLSAVLEPSLAADAYHVQYGRFDGIDTHWRGSLFPTSPPRNSKQQEDEL